MTRQKDLKRIIRTRMSKTGESYTAARAHVLAKPTSHTPTPTKRSAPAKAEAISARAVMPGVREATLVENTGHTWQQWVRLLDADDAATKSHRDIGVLLMEKHGVASWWAQCVTLGYERIKGLREPGQQRAGDYVFSKTRTFDVPVAALFEAWANDASRRRWLGPLDVRRATPPKSMRLQPSDGTAVVVTFTHKGDGKSLVDVTHSKLPTKAASDAAKRYWADRLDALKAWLAAPAARKSRNS